MKVIFLKNIPGAKKNQIKEVAKGYALNYLLPKKLAIIATADKITNLKKIDNSIQKENKNLDQKIKKMIEIISKLKITITAKVNQEGHLFGGIGSEDISKILKEKHNLKINKDSIDLTHHLKTIGEHKVAVKIAENKVTFLKIIIKKENEKTKK